MKHSFLPLLVVLICCSAGNAKQTNPSEAPSRENSGKIEYLSLLSNAKLPDSELKPYAKDDTYESAVTRKI